MEAKEKAKQLVERFINAESVKNWGGMHKPIAIECALIAVDEILKSNPIIPLEFMLESESLDLANEYWQQVKEQIELL